MSDTKILGPRLKELRNQSKKTQEQVANDLGITRASYSHLENGRNEPDNETLSNLATYYGVTSDFLLGKNNTPKWANQKDVMDLKNYLDENDGSFTFGGDNLTEEEDQKLKIAMTQIFWDRHKHD